MLLCTLFFFNLIYLGGASCWERLHHLVLFLGSVTFYSTVPPMFTASVRAPGGHPGV